MARRMDWDHPPDVAEVRRWRLLVAGRRVIERRGLDAFTIEDLTREAQVAKGSFYTYFRSRDAFLDALRLELGEDVVQAVRSAAEGPWDGIFERMMRAVAQWLNANPELRALFGPAYLARSERPTFGPLMAVVTAVLQDGIAAGVFQPLETGSEDPIQATALVVYDALSAGINRVSPASPGIAPAHTAAFIQRGLRFEARKATGAGWGYRET